MISFHNFLGSQYLFIQLLKHLHTASCAGERFFYQHWSETNPDENLLLMVVIQFNPSIYWLSWLYSQLGFAACRAVKLQKHCSMGTPKALVLQGCAKALPASWTAALCSFPLPQGNRRGGLRVSTGGKRLLKILCSRFLLCLPSKQV